MNIIVFLFPFVFGAILANPIDVSSSHSVSVAHSSGPGQTSTFMETSVMQDGNYVVTRTNNGNTQVFEGSVSGPAVNQVETRNGAPGIGAVNNQVGEQKTSINTVIENGKIVMCIVNGVRCSETAIADLNGKIAEQANMQPFSNDFLLIPASQIIPTPSLDMSSAQTSGPYPPPLYEHPQIATNTNQQFPTAPFIGDQGMINSGPAIHQSPSAFQSSGQTVTASSSCATDANGAVQCSENKEVLTSRQHQNPVEPNRMVAPVNSQVLTNNNQQYPAAPSIRDQGPVNSGPVMHHGSVQQNGQTVTASSSCATDSNGVVQCSENKQVLTSRPNEPTRIVEPVNRQAVRDEAPRVNPGPIMQQSSSSFQTSVQPNGQILTTSSSCATDANGVLQCKENNQVLTSRQNENTDEPNRTVAPINRQVNTNQFISDQGPINTGPVMQHSSSAFQSSVQQNGQTVTASSSCATDANGIVQCTENKQVLTSNEPTRTVVPVNIQEPSRGPGVTSTATSTSCSTGNDGIQRCMTAERTIVARSVPEKKKTDKTQTAPTLTASVQVSDPKKD